MERLFLELKNEIASLLPRYKGGSLKERPEDAEKNICIFFEEYERLLVRHLVDHRNQHHYPRARNQTRLQRWWAGLIGGEPVMPLSEVNLSICLMKEEKRTVQQYGTIEFQLLIYEAGWKRDEEGNWEHNAEENFLERYTEVTLRYNSSNIVYLLVYI